MTARLRSGTPQPAPPDLPGPDLVEWREVVAVERSEAAGCVRPVGECESRASVAAQLPRARRAVDLAPVLVDRGLVEFDLRRR